MPSPSHRANAAKFYPSHPPQPAATAAAAPRAEAAKTLYRGYGQPLASYYDRRLAALRYDREGMGIAHTERAQLEAFAQRRGIKPEDLHEALTVLREHDLHGKGRTPEVKAARIANTLERLRLELGGTDKAQELIQRYVSVTSDLAKSVPSLAARANDTGAGEDERIIKVLAKYGESAPVTTEQSS